MRLSTGFCIIIMLSGCGMARQQEAQERQSKATADMKAAVEACGQSYPLKQNLVVARAHCLAEATAPIRPFVNFPDLYDQEVATRNLLSERWQAGKISQAEFEAQFYKAHSDVVAEEQRRRLANRAVNAQETAAAAASSPVICNRVGTTTICN